MNYPALVKTGNEPEYKENPYLPISSVGTDYTTANETNLPYGSALMTDTLDGSGKGMSQLHSKGITHIIHAAPKPRSNFSTDEDFVNCVVKSVQNSIILVDREDIQSQIETDNGIAVCLVGGGIYLGSCNPEKLAEGIIRGAVSQLEKCKNLREIKLIDWEGNPQHYFLKKILQLKTELFGLSTLLEKDNHFIGEVKNDRSKGVSVRVGDIRDKELHKASVIVNAANTYVGFGGGISGAIESQVGNSGAIDQEAGKLIGEFYSRIPAKQKKEEENNGEEENQNGGGSGSASFQLNFSLVPSWATNNFSKNYYFFIFLGTNGDKNITESQINKGIMINKEHKEIKKWEYLKYGPDSKYLIKFREKKQIYEVNDWLEVIDETGKLPLKNKDKGNGQKPTDGKNNKDNKTAAEWQEELRVVDEKVGQAFNEDKMKDWKEQGKFGQVKEVKKLFESVKDNSKFLNLIKTKLNSDSLEKFISDKTAAEAIKVIGRFKYDNLNESEKETRNKKMRKHYSLGENAALSDEQIDEFCYKVTTGKIIESSIDENQNSPNNTTTPENNILKYLGIGALVLIPLGLALVFFIRKRKK